MFKFDRLFLTMDKKGVSTYRLREECGIDSKTVRRLKANQNIEMKTLDRICSFLDCKIEDVVEFIKDLAAYIGHLAIPSFEHVM